MLAPAMRSVRDAIRKLRVRRTASRSAEIGRLYSPAELTALGHEIAKVFESLAEAHAPGCAIVGVKDWESPLAITVIPANRDAAEITIEFRQTSRTTMIVHIGAFGELQGWEGLNAKQSLLSTAKGLFQLVLEGRYREDVWVSVETGRHEGGQSYLVDAARVSRSLGSFREPHAPYQRLRLETLRFAPY